MVSALTCLAERPPAVRKQANGFCTGLPCRGGSQHPCTELRSWLLIVQAWKEMKENRVIPGFFQMILRS